MLFLINPPYGTSGEITSANGKEKKSGIATTLINSMMKLNNVGASSQQLYAQFVYRISLLQKTFGIQVNLGIFSPTLIMTGAQFKGLREYTGKFIDGYMIQASEFADVKANWAIAFTLWNTSVKDKTDQYNISVFTRNENEVKYNVISKELYIPEYKASDWAKQNKSKGKSIETFTMSNALNVTDGTCKISEDALAVALMNQNIVESNAQFVMILPRKLKGHLSAFEITKDSFNDIISLFTARRLIQPTWINWSDEYMAPNTNHPLYKQWEADCMVYSLFDSKSNQSSLRNINYNGKQWNIFNEFFWLSYREIEKLAGGECNKLDINTAIEDDIESFGKERFVYKKLEEVTLSPDAQAVLDKATELVKSSFKYRREFDRKHPEYHINTWDAGWYQIKGLLKEHDKAGLDEFNKLYKALEERLRPLVYELGFLYK